MLEAERRNMVLCTGYCVIGGGVGSRLMIKTHLLSCSIENPAKGSSLLIYDIMNELTGKKFSPKDPDDGMYRSCLCETGSLFPDC